MVQQAGPEAVGTIAPTDELHVFHYPSHSVVVHLTFVDDAEWRSMCGHHEHTRTGEHMIRSTHLFGTREDAEVYATKNGNVSIQRVATLRHDVQAIGQNLALKVDTDNDGNGNPRRGWIIYTPAGRCLGFINEGYAGHFALKAAGDVIELGTLAVTPRTYRNLRSNPYPQAA